MIEYDDFIYLDVYRTGSTHVIGLLEEICTGKPVRAFRHAALTKGRPWGLTGGKPVFATVRNPWDWYVSLWAIGSDGKSAIRKHLAPHLAAEELASLYDRADPRAAFSRWLARIHDAAFLDRVMKEHLPESGLASAVGLYTYRFLRVTTRYPRLLLRRPFVRDPDGAVRHHRRFKAYQTLLRNESLDDGLVAFVARHPRGFRPDAAEIIRAASVRHANASSRSLVSYRDYYSAADRDLVAGRDRFFIDAFGYSF
jgi:hypothetical protein